MIFVVDGNCLSIHTDSRKNNFLVMGERPTDDINDNVGTAEKEIGINFAKADLSLCYNSDESYLYMNKGRVIACLRSRTGYSGRGGGVPRGWAGKGVWYLFFRVFWLLLAKSNFLRGSWPLGFHPNLKFF